MFLKIVQGYLSFWAKIYLHKTKPQIIVTPDQKIGSSIRDMIYDIFAQEYSDDIIKNNDSLSTAVGVALTILGLKQPEKIWEWIPVFTTSPLMVISPKKYRFIILTLKIQDIHSLISYIKPKISVLNKTSSFAKELDLIKALSADGWAVLNIDDDKVRKASYGGRWHKITYALDRKADLSAANIKTENKKNSFKVVVRQSGSCPIIKNINKDIHSCLAAIAVGNIVGIPTSKIIKALQ